MPDLGDVAGQPVAVLQAEPGRREVAGHEVDAPGQAGVGGLDLADPLLGEVGELGLDQAGGGCRRCGRRMRGRSRDPRNPGNPVTRIVPASVGVGICVF